MPKRRLLLLDANRLSTFAWQGSQITQDDEFAPQLTRTGGLHQLFEEVPAVPLYLLADVSEEGFQIDDVPYVTGRDRAALLKMRASITTAVRTQPRFPLADQKPVAATRKSFSPH